MTFSTPILVTGAAGFIGFHLSQRLLAQGHRVVGYDCVNDYYDVQLKEDRLALLTRNPSFELVRADLGDKEALEKLFVKYRFEIVVQLAAQAGVRHSITHPYTYVDTNMRGFLNVLEVCRAYPPLHLLFASSSSVYGASKKLPFSVRDHTDHPLALYAASKKTNEMMAHAYAHLYNLPVTGLRFFSVYGTYGRPDLGLFMFTKAILAGRPIDIYNFGRMRRDFTYISDVVGIIEALLPLPPGAQPTWDATHPNPSTSASPYRILNVGNGNPVPLEHFIEVLERELGKKAIKNLLPLQSGDVEDTCADITETTALTGMRPVVGVDQGVTEFVKWYKSYYKVA